ncbi:MAG TPA: serine hydrolase domain-containing protein [Chloroflexota bacterium]|nr:serine hydrolase domain-containing protein [Chloroflexota bacterium]
MRRVRAALLSVVSLMTPLSFSPAAARAPASEAAAAKRFKEARAVIKRLVEEDGVPSITVAVAKDGKILWQEGFGWADRERRVPATPHTPYFLASTIKPITATAVMRLHEAGKLDLDSPVEKYLGGMRLKGLAGDSSAATVRRVLSHTAGLPLYYYFYPEGEKPMPRDLVISRYGMIVYPPGEQYFYSNLGFGLLAESVRNASGRRFEDYVRSDIFVPLGMNQSGFAVTEPIANQLAARYDMKQQRIPSYVLDFTGSGDGYSSAHDLLRFGMYHLGTPVAGQKSILTDQSMRLMQTFSGPPTALDRYGMGWFVDREQGFRRLRHGGNASGIFNQLNLYPDQRLAVVVLANQANQDLPKVVQAIASEFLPGYRLGDDSADDISLAAAGARSTPLPDFSGKWSGTLTTYAGTVPFALTFQPDGDIHVNLSRQYTALLNGRANFGGQLLGRFAGTMPTDDAREHPHSQLLLLRPEGNQLVGQLVAQTLSDPDIFALPGFLRLSPEGAAQ